MTRASQVIDKLDEGAFEQIVQSTPLCSIDIVVRDPDGAVMLGLRKNNPARDFYFVPGGRMRKNETIADAFRRILAEETSLESSIRDASLPGVYEHFYDTNWKDVPGYGTHYICLACELCLSMRTASTVDTQHSELIPPPDVDRLRVHPYTRAYLT